MSSIFTQTAYSFILLPGRYFLPIYDFLLENNYYFVPFPLFLACALWDIIIQLNGMVMLYDFVF